MSTTRKIPVRPWDGLGNPHPLLGGHENLRDVTLSLQHRMLRSILMKLHGVQEKGEDAFNARLKHILDLDLIEDRRPDGKGWRAYGLVDTLEIALCLQMQRSFIPPATAVRFIVDNRVKLDRFWSLASKGDIPRLYMEVDAFAAIGGAGRDKGRGSRGNETGTITMNHVRNLGAEAIQPSTLVINLNDLLNRVLALITRAPIADIKERAWKWQSAVI